MDDENFQKVKTYVDYLVGRESPRFYRWGVVKVESLFLATAPCPKVLAAGKGYDAKWLRHKLRLKVSGHKSKNDNGMVKSLLADQLRKLYPATSRSVLSPGFNASIEDSLFDGNASSLF